MSHLNRVIQLLDDDQVVFGCLIPNGSYENIQAVADGNHDFIIIEMEHSGFDLSALPHSLNAMLNKRRIAESGTVAPAVAPLVRIPTNAREGNEWIIKQVLDAGAFGIVVPHLETVEEARSIVAAMRYPRPADPTQSDLPGKRGWSPRPAPRYWGLSVMEYLERSDLWPVNPDGDLFLMMICETALGVRNLPGILREVQGISAVWAGGGDLSVSLGHRADMRHPEVEEGLATILRVCIDAGVPCMTAANGDTVGRRLEEGYRVILAQPTYSFHNLDRGREAAHRS